jgi:hypothetical protein
MIKKEWKEKGFIDSELPEELRNNKTKQRPLPEITSDSGHTL